MIVGKKDILEKYGMPEKHLDAIRLAVSSPYLPDGTPNAAYQSVISFRPVTPASRSLIEEEGQGFYQNAGKPFSLKAKTAKVGPFAGYVVVDPKFGRDTSKKGMEKHTNEINNAKLKDQNLVEVDLYLSESRINECKALFPGQLHVAQFNDGIYQFMMLDHHTNQPYYVFGVYDKTTNKYQIMEVDKENNTLKAIKVMGLRNAETGICHPIITDYDLYLISHPFSTLSLERKNSDERAYDQTPCPVQGIQDRNSKWLKDDIIQEDPDKGNITQRTRDICESLNLYFCKMNSSHSSASGHMYDHGYNHSQDMALHNQEIHNVFSQNVEDDFPALFVLPDEIAGKIIIQDREINLAEEKFLLVENIHDLHLLEDAVRLCGYYWPHHPKHAKEENGGRAPFPQEVLGPIDDLLRSDKTRRLRSSDNGIDATDRLSLSFSGNYAPATPNVGQNLRNSSSDVLRNSGKFVRTFTPTNLNLGLFNKPKDHSGHADKPKSQVGFTSAQIGNNVNNLLLVQEPKVQFRRK